MASLWSEPGFVQFTCQRLLPSSEARTAISTPSGGGGSRGCARGAGANKHQPGPAGRVTPGPCQRRGRRARGTRRPTRAGALRVRAEPRPERGAAVPSGSQAAAPATGELGSAAVLERRERSRGEQKLRKVLGRGGRVLAGAGGLASGLAQERAGGRDERFGAISAALLGS